MGRKCDICQRGSTKGASRSHSKVKTLKRQHINLQNRKLGDVKIKVCTSCLRTLTKDERAQAKK